jgi:hypothetical protein
MVVHWLQVGSIITGLVGPTLAQIVGQILAWRLNHPKPKPENRPKTRPQRLGAWLLRACLSPFVFPPLGIVTSICLLPYELHHATPVTGQMVFAISFSVASLFYNVILMFLLAVARDVRHLRSFQDNYRAIFNGLIELGEESIKGNLGIHKLQQGIFLSTMNHAALLRDKLEQLDKGDNI